MCRMLHNNRPTQDFFGNLNSKFTATQLLHAERVPEAKFINDIVSLAE